MVEVKGERFHVEGIAVPSELDLTGPELRNASTVVANDPFRAVQALPGVSATDNNDFFGQFSVLGVPFEHVGVYVDDVLVPQPFHSIPGFREGASLSVFSSETVDEMDLMPVGFPERYGDSVGAALAVRTREGSRTSPRFTVAAGMADSELIGEGPLGKSGKGSWLASARKSYLDYLVHLNSTDPFTNVGFEDGDFKLNYDVAPRQTVHLYFLQSHTGVDRHDPANTLDDFDTGKNDFSLGRVGWTYTPRADFLLDTDAAYIRQRFDTRNLSKQVLHADYYGEWAGSARTTWNWRKGQILEAGYTARRLRDSGYSVSFQDGAPSVFSISDGRGLRQDGYVQQVTTFGSRLHFLSGLRWDHLQNVQAEPISEQASAAWQVMRATTLQLGFGRYAELDNIPVSPNCLPPGFSIPPGFPQTVLDVINFRSNQFVAGIEQQWGENQRFRVEGFARENHEIFGARAAASTGCGPVVPIAVPLNLPDRGYTRGTQIIFQRRSAKRLSGWVGYTLNYAREHFPAALDGGPNVTISAPDIEDQRHTVNSFAMFQLTPTISLSVKFLYGSGMPLTSLDFISVGTTVVPTPSSERLGSYQRLDCRADKTWNFRRWQMKVSGEVLNLTRHNNPRFITLSFDPTTDHSTAVVERGLPLTPTVGLSFEF